MGVSFEVARVGTRYKPKLLPIDDKADDAPLVNDSQPSSIPIGAEIVGGSNKKHNNVWHSTSEELEVSFSLNLFKDGFSMAKGDKFLSDVPKQLLPYDKASETLFSAIEYGWLPGDILDDIPCKYVNGALICEIRDYRDSLPYEDGHTSSTANVPIVHKLTLQLCMESVVKDILSVLNDSWTYKDLLEIESCIIKALQPDLNLNPEPLGGMLFGEPRRKKIDLGIAWSWKKRKLSDGPMQGLPIRNSNVVSHALCDYLTQKYKPQCAPLEKEKNTSCSQENTSSCFYDPQGINSALGCSSPSHALMFPQTPNFVDVPNQPLTNAYNSIALGNSIVPCENSSDEHSTKGMPNKKPKQEPVDLPKLQLVGSQVSIAPQGPELQQPYDRCLKNGNAAPKRKVSQNLQATAADGSLSTTQNSNSLQKAGHKNSRSRGLKAEMSDSVISISSRNLTSANSLTVRNPCPPQQSVEVNKAADRLLKILKVSERYGLINRKLKLEQFFQKKPSFFQTPPLVGVHLASLENSGKSEDSMGCKISSSKYSSYWETRTLIFSHEYHIIQRSDSPVVGNAALVKLVMLENLNLGTVEVHVYYGRDGDHPISISLLPTFPSSLRSANQFACQFISLLIREGYRIISDQVGSLPCDENGELGMKKQPIVSNSNLTYSTVKPSATCSSSPPSRNSSSRMPFQFRVATQSPQPNALSGVNVTAVGNSLSSPQLMHSNSSFKLQIDNLQQQMRSIQQWWQLGANKFLWLEYQMQLLKHRQEQELILRTESPAQLGAAASSHDALPLNGGQRIRNIESSSYSHITGNNGSGPAFSGGLMQWMNSLSPSNNPQNNHILGLNDKQLFGALSDDRFAAFPKLNTSQGQSFIGGFPTLRNASMLSIARADDPNMRNMFSNHREPWAEASQTLHMDIGSMPGPKKMARLADQVGSSLPSVPSLHDHLPQLSTQQLNPIGMQLRSR
ncbi:uncharacterized protein LOC129321571 isoform X3 [Prosopis cineraria]|uniref:uncharacterized protein LOC129321571 isoform X3 n=1 Tax=Prosopis cineraria TaxID=364024 RepID=UPI002410113E|nr:uncharacterized protein LOC129321571 isoform X3 [Prosopis cineraria]